MPETRREGGVTSRAEQKPLTLRFGLSVILFCISKKSTVFCNAWNEE
jgi:hypothetical protein